MPCVAPDSIQARKQATERSLCDLAVARICDVIKKDSVLLCRKISATLSAIRLYPNQHLRVGAHRMVRSRQKEPHGLDN